MLTSLIVDEDALRRRQTELRRHQGCAGRDEVEDRKGSRRIDEARFRKA